MPFSTAPSRGLIEDENNSDGLRPAALFSAGPSRSLIEDSTPPWIMLKISAVFRGSKPRPHGRGTGASAEAHTRSGFPRLQTAAAWKRPFAWSVHD